MGIGICCKNSPVTEENNINEMRNGIIPNMENNLQENKKILFHIQGVAY